jgi:hypothetical protein
VRCEESAGIQAFVGRGHKVHIYKEYHSVCPLVGIGTLPPTPSLASECAPPPGTKGGGAHTRAGEGLGESQFQRLEEKLSTLPTLWLGVTVNWNCKKTGMVEEGCKEKELKRMSTVLSEASL